MTTDNLYMESLTGEQTPATERLQYHKANMRAHYLRAIMLHVETERNQSDMHDEDDWESEEEFIEDGDFYPSARDYAKPSVDYSALAEYSLETLSIMNKCRRPGMKAFFTKENLGNESVVRNVMRYMMDDQSETGFREVLSVVKTLSLAFEFEGTTDYNSMHPKVWEGLRAAIKFLLDNPSIKDYAPIAAEPVMLNPDCAVMVVDYFNSRFASAVDTAGFDPDAFYAYLNTPSPALAAGSL